MNALNRLTQYRAAFIGIAAQRDHLFDVIKRDVIKTFGRLSRDVDANLLHDPHGERMDAFRFGAGAENFKSTVGRLPGETFGHLTAAGVAGAEK